MGHVHRTNYKSQLSDLTMQTLALELVQEVHPPVVGHGQAESAAVGLDVLTAFSIAVPQTRTNRRGANPSGRSTGPLLKLLGEEAELSV